jgi:hypothetical protein
LKPNPYSAARQNNSGKVGDIVKKTIVTLALALALAASAAVAADYEIAGNSTDDGLHAIQARIYARFTVKIDQAAFVDQQIYTSANSGNQTIVCGEDCEDVLVETGSATNNTANGVDVNSSDVEYDGLTGGGTAEISGNSSDDGAFAINAEYDTEEKTEVQSFEDVKQDLAAVSDTGSQTVVAGDDGVRLTLKSGVSMNTVENLMSVGFAKFLRNQ